MTGSEQGNGQFCTPAEAQFRGEAVGDRGQRGQGDAPLTGLAEHDLFDLVVIVLDLTNRRATITVGTDELLLRYQGGE